MKASDLQQKSVKSLNDELLSLLHEQLKLRVQAKNGQLKLTHLLKNVRRNIARVKTLLALKKRESCNGR